MYCLQLTNKKKGKLEPARNSQLGDYFMNNIDKHKLRHPELEAEIFYLSETEGGRKTAVGNGFRGQFYYNGRDWDAIQQFLNKEICNPGESVVAYLQTASPHYHVGQFSVGQKFEIREGGRIVGKGEITKILRPDFNDWSGSTFLESLDDNITPYTDNNDLPCFRVDFEKLLIATGIIANVEFEMTGILECMILVKCKLASKTHPRIVTEKIIECWEKGLATSNKLYKLRTITSLNNKNQGQVDSIILTFAAWQFNFITGQIIVTE